MAANSESGRRLEQDRPYTRKELNEVLDQLAKEYVGNELLGEWIGFFRSCADKHPADSVIVFEEGVDGLKHLVFHSPIHRG